MSNSTKNSPRKVLITGANGQIGQVLAQNLRARYGTDNVITSDITKPKVTLGPFVFLDILNTMRLQEVITDHKITEVYHLAAILSASGEWNPIKTWNINLNGLLSILDLAKDTPLDKVFFPSTIAVFGTTTPRVDTPQDTALQPETVYGMSKTSGELWCNYYHNKFGVDVRSIRYPGIISHQSIPAGGTTDYAVEVFHEAIQHNKYECFLEKDTRLPMMYIDDAIRATIELMEAPAEKVKTRIGYNLSAMSFSPEELFTEIKKYIPELAVTYKPDFRQEIASSWTESIDDQRARDEWQWSHDYGLPEMVKVMTEEISKKYKA